MEYAFARKPQHGKPCNRCGLCCQATICAFGAVLFGRQLGPCPALEQTATGFVCGVAAHPMRYARVKTTIHGPATMRRTALLLIGAGDGCDHVEDEPFNHAFYSRLVKAANETRDEARRARRLWGV